MKIGKKQLMVWFLMLMPVIDIMNGFSIRVMHIKGIGIAFHIGILLYMLFLVLNRLGINQVDFLIFIVGSYLFTQTFISNLAYGLSVFYNISYVIKLIYFLSILATLNMLRNEKDIWEKIKRVYTWLYPLGSILARILGFKFTAYGDGGGMVGFMPGLNSYTFTMIVVFYWSLEYLLEKIRIVNFARIMLVAITLLLVGTKSAYIYTVAFLGYLLFLKMKKRGVKSKFRIFISIIVVVIILYVAVRLYSGEINKILQRQTYFMNYYGTDSFSSIMNFLTSSRWGRITEYSTDFYGSIISVIFGLGYGYFVNTVTTEMDIFNLLFIFGVMGLLLYCHAVVKISRIREYRNDSWVPIMLLFSYLFFGGHVLTDVMANGIFAIVIIMGQKEPIVKRKGKCIVSGYTPIFIPKP